MPANPFVGRWTYRSFLNLPDVGASPEDLVLARAELTLEPCGGNKVEGRLMFGTEGLNMSGTVSHGGSLLEAGVGDVKAKVGHGGGPPTITLRATGIKGTMTDGWIYDYVGYMTPKWPNGIDQRTAFVGTVIRVVTHGQSKAGEVFSFITVAA